MFYWEVQFLCNWCYSSIYASLWGAKIFDFKQTVASLTGCHIQTASVAASGSSEDAD